MRHALDVGERTVSLSNLDKVLYPSTGFRKRDLLAYYEAVAPVLLPHLADRALHLGRWPDGVDHPGWFQANCRGAPSWLRIHTVTGKRGQTLRYAVIDDLASLLWIANLGTIELHPFHATTTHPDSPREMVFDLDPGPGCGLADCVSAARLIRAALGGRRAVLKLSGVKGLHVYVPLDGTTSFVDAKASARAIAAALAAEHPDWLTDTMARDARTNRVFIDCSQNDPGKQTVAPYSLRATAVPLVSLPVCWDELDDVRPTQPRAAIARIAHVGDLFQTTTSVPEPRDEPASGHA